MTPLTPARTRRLVAATGVEPAGLAAQSRAPSEDSPHFATDCAQERSAPEPRGDQGSEEEHRIHARAPFALPVDVLEVQPQREFVQRERRTHAVENCGQAREDRG